MSENLPYHIFPKAQVVVNKNAHNIGLHFLTQFFKLSHVVPSILFWVLALKTLQWKFMIGCWNFSTMTTWFQELIATEWIAPCERAWKTILENGVRSEWTRNEKLTRLIRFHSRFENDIHPEMQPTFEFPGTHKKLRLFHIQCGLLWTLPAIAYYWSSVF